MDISSESSDCSGREDEYNKIKNNKSSKSKFSEFF